MDTGFHDGMNPFFIFIVIFVITFVFYIVFVHSTPTNIPSELLNGEKVYITLTTSPVRIDKIKRCLESLLAQHVKLSDNTILYPTVVLSIPTYYRKTEPYTIPDWLNELVKQHNGRLVIYRPDKDYGPATKLVGGYLYMKENNEKGYILYADDDRVYPQSMVNVLLYKAVKDPKVVWCCIFGTPPYTSLSDYYNREYKNFYIPMGTNGVIVHSDLLKEDFIPFINKSIESIDCYLSDDVIFGKYFSNHGYHIKTAYNFTDYNAVILIKYSEDYSGDLDALHKGSYITENDVHKKKYTRCCTYLHNNETQSQQTNT